MGDEKRTTLSLTKDEVTLIGAGLHKVREALPPGREAEFERATRLIARVWAAYVRVTK